MADKELKRVAALFRAMRELQLRSPLTLIECLKRLGGDRWKDRVFEMVDRTALADIAGSDVTPHRPRPFI